MSNSQHSFLFGKSGEALLGVYYAPDQTISQCSHAVVLCPAFGQEFLRSHRAFRQLALLLARAGHHVLRFDYFGTGDSAGLLENASISRWLDDITLARQELINISGAKKISVTGLRLGASLAVLHAAERPQEAWHSIALWEPVISGAAYLRDFGHSETRPVSNIMGFPITNSLRAQIEAIDLRNATLNTSRIDCVYSKEDESLSTFVKHAGSNARLLKSRIDIDGDWAKTDEFLSAMLPREMILRLVDGLTAGAGQ